MQIQVNLNHDPAGKWALKRDHVLDKSIIMDFLKYIFKNH